MAAGDDYQETQPTGDIDVQKDEVPVEDPVDAETADSDEQLVRDGSDAIDKDNIIDERTRGAKPEGSYREPGDDEGIPTDEEGIVAIG
ncbi:MAG: hypothetical protein MMC23_004527 [Stictis urceolatum]|nr:hypothetical protein [Stictis urceolata]